MRPRPRIALILALTLACGAANAQGGALRGWALDRFEPSPAGDAFFLAEHPWYSAARVLAAGLVTEHALSPLVLTRDYADGSERRDAVVSGMLVGHVVAAASFLDRVSVHVALPVSLLQVGSADPTMASQLAPATGVALGDLKIGARVRILGESDTTPFSLHAGVSVWAPTGARDANTGDERARVEPRAIAAGRVGALRWSYALGFMFRPDIDGGGVVIGDELRMTAGLGLALLRDRLHVGLEGVLFTALRTLPTDVGVGNSAFVRGAWGSELLLGARYTIAGQVSVGAAGGFGVEQAGGVPAGRFVLAVQYAPDLRRR
jgi:hypothetical protein